MDNDISTLFPEIDEKATCKKVAQFLKYDLKRFMRISGRPAGELKAIAYSGMPKSASVSNQAETTIVKRLNAEQMVRRVIEAISVCDEDCKRILSLLYLEGYDDTMCRQYIGYSESSYFHDWKPKALLQFAECFLYYDFQVFKKMQ